MNKQVLLKFTAEEKELIKKVEYLLWDKLSDPEISIDYDEKENITDAWRGLYETLKFKNLFESEGK